MIDYIKRKLKIGRYSDLAVNQRRAELQQQLMFLREKFDTRAYTWNGTFMCCTLEAAEIRKILRKHDMETLLDINDRFLITKYNISKGKLFPVHAVHDEIGKPMSVVRRELFDFWCEELLGEKL
tara:strand:+ start:2664 stop:3035 length:372 start_codon:yes stop_codon:yes gene_type:complete